MNTSPMKNYLLWGVAILVVLGIGYGLGSSRSVPPGSGVPEAQLPVSAPTSTERAAVISPGAAPKAVPTSALVSMGSFNGSGGHTSWGIVSVLQSGSAYAVEFGSNFVVTSSTNLYVYLERADRVLPSVDLGLLKSATGAQRYAIPAGIDPRRYDRVVVFSKQGSVPFSSAALTITR